VSSLFLELLKQVGLKVLVLDSQLEPKKGPPQVQPAEGTQVESSNAIDQECGVSPVAGPLS